MTVFGPELHDLTREDVLRLLREAEAEPLLWEAKGVNLDKHRIRKEVCARACSPSGARVGPGRANEAGRHIGRDGDPPSPAPGARLLTA